MFGIVMATSLLSATVGQCPGYSVDSVGGVPCGVFGPTGAWVSGLNEAGLTCGNSEACNLDDFAFMWQPGSPFMPVTFPMEVGYVRAVDIGADGTTVGDVDAEGQAGRRAFASRAGKTVLLQPLVGHVWSEAHGISNSGVVVGASAGGADFWAVFWNGDVPTRLVLPVGPTNIAEEINDNAEICGWMGVSPNPGFGATPFIWHNGKTTTLPLPTYAVANTGAATAINNLGDACGYFFVDDPDSDGYFQRACAWIDGEFIDLGVFPGSVISHPYDINDAREIVGECALANWGASRGFLWRDGVMHELLDLLPAETFNGATGTAINNAGQIAGGAANLDNDHVAFRLTPALPAIPGNTNCDDVVDVDDLINVILHWNPQGPVGGRPADVNRDNRINFEDLIAVIRGWSIAG